MCSFKGTFDSHENIVNYMGPSPPSGSGDHRYCFLLFESNDHKDLHNERQRSHHRGKFRTRDFIRRYHFGNPIFATFFFSRND